MFALSLESVTALRSDLKQEKISKVENNLVRWINDFSTAELQVLLSQDNDLADSLFILLRELFLSSYQISDPLFNALSLNKSFITLIDKKSQFNVDIIVNESGLLDKQQYSPAEIKLLLALFFLDSSINIPWQNLFKAIADPAIIAYIGVAKVLTNEQSDNVAKNKKQLLDAAKDAPVLNAEFLEDLTPLVAILERCRDNKIMDADSLTGWVIKCIQNFSNSKFLAKSNVGEFNSAAPKIAIVVTDKNVGAVRELIPQLVNYKQQLALLATEPSFAEELQELAQNTHFISVDFSRAASTIQELNLDILIYTSITKDCLSIALGTQRLAHRQIVLDANQAMKGIGSIDKLGNSESPEALINELLNQGVGKPKLSICIPTYNRAELLEKSLTHLAKFTEIDLEINISNNASSDHTLEVIKRFEGSFYKLNHVALESTIDMIYNWDTAINMATQEYAFAVADDDLPLESGLLEAITMLDRDQNLMVVYGGFQIFNLHNPAMRYSNPLLVENTKYYDSSNKAELVKDRIILEIPVFRNHLYQDSRVVHENVWSLSWCFAGTAIDNGSVAVTPIFLLDHYFHDECFSSINYANSHFNFCVNSEVEIFIASLELTQQQKTELHNDYIRRNFKFKIQRCVESNNLMQARFFIQKGQMYDQDYFSDLLPIWDSKYLVPAAREAVLKMVKVKNFVKKVVLIEADNNKMSFLKKVFSDFPLPVVEAQQKVGYQQSSDEYLVSFDEISDNNLRSGCYSSFFDMMNRLKFTDKAINFEP